MTDELYIQPVTRIVGCATEAHERALSLARADLPEQTRDELTKIALLIREIPPMRTRWAGSWPRSRKIYAAWWKPTGTSTRRTTRSRR